MTQNEVDTVRRKPFKAIPEGQLCISIIFTLVRIHLLKFVSHQLRNPHDRHEFESQIFWVLAIDLIVSIINRLLRKLWLVTHLVILSLSSIDKTDVALRNRGQGLHHFVHRTLVLLDHLLPRKSTSCLSHLSGRQLRMSVRETIVIL